MVIRKDQMDKLSSRLSRRNIDSYTREIRHLYPSGSVDYCDTGLRQIIEEDQVTAQSLKITESADIWRFISLRYLPEIRGGTRLIPAVASIVLNNTQSPAKERLDFLQRHAVTSLKERHWHKGNDLQLR